VTGYGAHDLAEFTARLAELRATLVPPTEPAAYVAYTDGACFGNPSGPGGWAAALFGPDPSARWQLFGHLSSTSNNRAEALGVLGALEWIPPASKLALHSDSELTVRILQGHYKVKANTDIWDSILRTRLEKRLETTYEWVRGHAGDPLNELADQLSKLGALNGHIEDLGTVALAAPPATPPELAGLEPHGDWEREFLASVGQQLRRGRSLSPKQQAIVDRIRGRASGSRQ
jgi:ribonuclease HI